MSNYVLIACEYSGVVRDAFARRGWNAWSCDLLPTQSPGNHFEGNLLERLDGHTMGPDYNGETKVPWDLIIAHPPCTYLSSSGMHWTTRGLRDIQLTYDAVEFVKKIVNANARHIAIENPIGILSTYLRKPDQIIQPYNFGDDASKRTCLWLKGLPKLVNTQYIEPRMVNGKARWSNQTDSGQNKLTPSSHRALDRAKTYKGIAEAMSDQWTRFIQDNVAGL